jgi:hypothetical protein
MRSRAPRRTARPARSNEAVFYTSGRTSNEAAFLYQLFARRFGTNNLPDCSNLCHESSSVALAPVIGVGKGTVGLDDFALADAIFVIGQNPGSNHPRMLSALQAAKRRGARIVAINPLRERGLVRFTHPQQPLAWLGRGTAIAISPPGARRRRRALRGIAKSGARGRERRPGQVLDWPFLSARTTASRVARRRARDWGRSPRAAGSPSRRCAKLPRSAQAPRDRVLGMGITQHARRRERAGDHEPAADAREHRRAGCRAVPVRGH